MNDEKQSDELIEAKSEILQLRIPNATSGRGARTAKKPPHTVTRGPYE
jgi:hypothetical protein